MDDLQEPLKDLLQPSEHIAIACTVQRLPGFPADSKTKSLSPRMLAMVSHSGKAIEQACLFVVARDDTGNIAIDDLLVITPDLSMSLLQLSSGNQKDLSSNFTVTFTEQEESATFLFEEQESLQKFVVTCRQYIKLAEENARSTKPATNEWVAVYRRSSLARLRKIHTLSTSIYRTISSVAAEPATSLVPSAGDRSQETADFFRLEDAWLRRELQSQIKGYATLQNMQLRIGTFNVNGQLPSGDLSPWITGRENAHADLFVLGFQELDLSAEALLYSTSSAREDLWTAGVFTALGDRASEYEKIASKQLVGILLIIFAKRTISANVTNIGATSLGSGIMGMMGNKGGVAIRFDLYDNAMCFVNTHLAAYDEMVTRRNADYLYLSTKMSFGQGLPSSIFDCQALFWLGGGEDLNYRIDFPDIDIRALIKEGDCRTLRLRDQLLVNQRDGNCFVGFSELPVEFGPTYRFEIGVTDALGHDWKRRPAWTDRILRRAVSDIDIAQQSYESYPEIAMSDHKPVAALFQVQARQIDTDALLSTVGQILDDLDAQGEPSSDEHPPSATLSLDRVDFGKIQYGVPLTLRLILKNDGTVRCAFRFVPRRSGNTFCEPWLGIEPTSGYIPSGQSETVQLTAEVTSKDAANLNFGNGCLEDILILHLMHGKDFFISVRGSYQRTCFSSPMALLVRLPGPIRTYSGKESDLLLETKALNAPREVLQMVSWLMRNAVGVQDLFVEKGDLTISRRIQECLDNGRDIPAPGATWLDYFHITSAPDLPEPIVPKTLENQCMKALSRDDALEVVSQFPVVSANVWIAITSMLHYIVQQNENVADAAKRLAAIFARAMFRFELGSDSPMTPLGQRIFLLFFISGT